MRWLELFAGAGGAALGIKATGGEAVACVEWDADACATLAAAGFPAVHADVRDWTAAIKLRQEFSRGSSVKVIDVDAMWASFPCQCWSSAGKRIGAMDPRNGWPWTVDAIDAVRPGWFVAENVPGLAQHSEKDCGNAELCPGCYLDGVILPQLRERFARVDVWRLNARDWGVPQSRQRLFIIAGPNYVQPPARTHAEPQRCLGLFSTFKPWVTSGGALGIDGMIGTGQTSELADGERIPHEVSTDRPAPSVRAGSRGPMYILGGGRNASDGTRSYRDLTDEPSTTVAAVAIGNAGPWVCNGSDDDKRALTLDELAILQDFPPNYPWVGGVTSRRRQTGNAVPPRLAAAVAGAVSKAAR